jgi:hypothetical protein
MFYITSCVVILGFVFAIVDDNFLKTKQDAEAATDDMPVNQIGMFLTSTVMTTVRFYPPELPLMACLETHEEGEEAEEQDELLWSSGHESGGYPHPHPHPNPNPNPHHTLTLSLTPHPHPHPSPSPSPLTLTLTLTHWNPPPNVSNQVPHAVA